MHKIAAKRKAISRVFADNSRRTLNFYNPGRLSVNAVTRADGRRDNCITGIVRRIIYILHPNDFNTFHW